MSAGASPPRQQVVADDGVVGAGLSYQALLFDREPGLAKFLLIVGHFLLPEDFLAHGEVTPAIGVVGGDESFLAAAGAAEVGQCPGLILADVDLAVRIGDLYTCIR